MKIGNYGKAFLLTTALFSNVTLADSISGTGFINYTWLNAVVNQTPVEPSACPEINTDIYGAGFKVALQRSFYGTATLTGSRWFPKSEIWASVGVGPVYNSFGIIFGNIQNISELPAEKEKRLPDNYEEIKSWKVTDSAYWESQGGASFYLGTGITPIDIGVFAVATGGWVNYLQKTGPNRVYVEMSRKKIKSVSFGVGVNRPNISIEKVFENSNGFAFEFILDNQESIEAFERFMAGDMTKAQDLSKRKTTGVNKISDLSAFKNGLTRSFGLATPFIPFLSYKKSSERAYDHSEENSVWDESLVKDTGIFVKQRNHFLVGQQLKEVRSFTGGKVTNTSPGLNGKSQTENLFGNFKYAYQSNWGQERRLRKYISKVKALTGLVEETCARVPSFEDSLGFSQVILEVNWSDSYVKELIDLKSKDTKLLEKIKLLALNEEKNQVSNELCNILDNDNYDDTCTQNSSNKVITIFKNLEKYSANMKKSYSADKKEFTKNLTKFGEEVWKSPSVFKAFYEKGKVCGQDFKFEISGLRLTRHAVDKKFAYTEDCTK